MHIENDDGGIVAVTSASENLRGAALQQRLAYGLAMALSDPEFQERVHGQISASTVSERKLWLREMLGGTDASMRGAVANSLGTEPARILAAIDSLPEMEFYLPVDEHRASWSPGAAYFVVAESESDKVVQGFDPHGNRVHFKSTDPPPSTAVFTLVEAEASFPLSQADVSEDVPTAPMASLQTGDVRVALTYSALGDNGESWWRGDPEIEIHTFARINGQNTWYSCASGAHTDSRFKFDQNDTFWSGDVLFSDNTFGIWEASEGLWFEVWEDDNNDCQSNRHPTSPYDHSNIDGNSVATWATVAVAVSTTSCYIDYSRTEPDEPTDWVTPCLAMYTLTLAMAAIVGQGDDFIGRASFTQPCAPHVDGGQWLTAWNGSTDAASLLVEVRGIPREVCKHVHLEGPDHIYNPDTYMWTATPKGGEGSYQYQWAISTDGSSPTDIPGATSRTYSRYVGDGGTIRLAVRVTGAGGYAANTTREVVSHISGCDPGVPVC